MYDEKSCDMIAVKREVAAVNTAGFPWSECLGRPDWHRADPKTDDKSLYRLTVCNSASKSKFCKQKIRNDVREPDLERFIEKRQTGHARECVQSPLVVLH